MNRPFSVTCRLAVRDWLDDRLLSLCGVLTLASVLAPLLILFGVRYGVIETLQARLLSDPATLSITSVGSGTYSAAWFKDITQRPDVAFGILTTRNIAATMVLTKHPDATISPRTPALSVYPTGPSDPLLTHNGLTFRGITDDSGKDPILISEAVARTYGFVIGDALYGILDRKNPQQGIESVRLPLRVVGILPYAAEDREAIYAALPLLETMEDYRNYIAVAQRLFEGEPPPKEPRTYPGFRVTAKSLNDVGILRDYFIEKNIETNTKAVEIEVFKNLDTSLTLVFWLIAVTACCGFMAATASNVLAAVRRKARHLGMLRLMGLPGVNFFPLIQALLTGAAGTLVAGTLYLVTSLCINSLFAEQAGGASVCRLPLTHFLLALGLVLALSALASLQAASQAAKLEPSNAIREI